MLAGGTAHPTARGATLLLEHCAVLYRFDESRPTARSRLELAVGGELARMLLGALAGDHRQLSRGLLV